MKATSIRLTNQNTYFSCTYETHHTCKLAAQAADRLQLAVGRHILQRGKEASGAVTKPAGWGELPEVVGSCCRHLGCPESADRCCYIQEEFPVCRRLLVGLMQQTFSSAITQG